MKRNGLVLLGLLLVVGAVNLLIAEKERLLARGTPMLLELAPVDPRSLIQGDYMRLDYAIARQGRDPNAWPRDGHLVVTVDADDVARFVRRDDGTPLARGEHLLAYRVRGDDLRVGTDAFYFQEGHADRYAAARYGELRVDDSGTSVLVGLRDAARQPLR